MADLEVRGGFEEALAHREGPALVLGSAGSGRTELIARRFEQLVASGAPVEGILVLAQSAANRADLRERLALRLDDSYEEQLSRSGRPRHRVARFEHILDWWSRHLPV